MTESHIKKETWLLGNRGPEYIRNVTEPQPHRTKNADRVKIEKIDLTFIFSSLSRHAQQTMDSDAQSKNDPHGKEE